MIALSVALSVALCIALDREKKVVVDTVRVVLEESETIGEA